MLSCTTCELKSHIKKKKSSMEVHETSKTKKGGNKCFKNMAINQKASINDWHNKKMCTMKKKAEEENRDNKTR